MVAGGTDDFFYSPSLFEETAGDSGNCLRHGVVSLDRLGLQLTSTLDFPGRVAAVIFTMGCPLRCPYCHNPELIRGPAPSSLSFLPRDDVLAFLKRRRPVLQGVAVTGGEPFMHADLPDLVQEVAALRYAVKLDTTGFFPDMLRTVLAIPAVEYVAMDVKTLPAYYDRVAAAPVSAAGTIATTTAVTLLRSMSILREWRDEAGYADTSVLTVSQSFDVEAAFHKSWFV